MFLDPDEYIILMNLPKQLTFPVKGNPLNDEELKRLKDIGCKTILNAFMWPVQAAEGWGPIDELMDQAKRLGMKCVLTVPHRYPNNLPLDWYARSASGMPIVDCLSIWNPEAVDGVIALLKQCMDRYGGDDVLIIHAGSQGGEAVLYQAPCYYDRWAISSLGGVPDIEDQVTIDWLHQTCVDFYRKVDAVLVHQHNSIWNALQWLIGHWGACTGNGAQDQIYKMYKETWPDASRVLLQYTYFPHGEPNPTLVKGWMNSLGMDVIVEAQFIPGLEATTPLSIEWGFRGQVLAPLHPWGGDIPRLTEEHYEKIEKAQRLWENS